MIDQILQFISGGLLQWSWWAEILIVLALTHITIVCVTLFLHRAQAHRALDLHPIASHFFRFWLWLTTGQQTKQWVAVHRKHHARCETKEDPHSPQIEGIKKVLFDGAGLYRAAAKQQEISDRYGHGTPDDWMERNIYIKRDGTGLVLLLILELGLFGLPGLAMWCVQMMWIPFFAAGVINGIGHYFGYRNFECPDASKNISPWGILVGGEELHNNHHTYGTSAKFSVKKWEFDIGWFYINILRGLKLAKVRKVPPKTVCVSGKKQVDADTLRAILGNRFQVMAHYSKEVISPVFQVEQRAAEEAGEFLGRKVKTMLIREKSLLGERDEKHLQLMLEGHHALRTAYEFRMKLQAIWARTTASQKELIDATIDWCMQAEATSVEALHKFAAKLRTYTQVSGTDALA
jgi:stearoyl-CoA desaturase (Delta-9 desaturase)